MSHIKPAKTNTSPLQISCTDDPASPHKDYYIPTQYLNTPDLSFSENVAQLIDAGYAPEQILHPAALIKPQSHKLILCGNPRTGNVLTHTYLNAIFAQRTAPAEKESNDLANNLYVSMSQIIRMMSAHYQCDQCIDTSHGVGVFERKYIFTNGVQRYHLTVPALDILREPVYQTHTHLDKLISSIHNTIDYQIIALVRDPLTNLLSFAEFIPPASMAAQNVDYSGREQIARERLNSKSWIDMFCKQIVGYCKQVLAYKNQVNVLYYEDLRTQPHKSVEQLFHFCHLDATDSEVTSLVDQFHERNLTHGWSKHFNADTNNKVNKYISQPLYDYLESKGLIAVGQQLGYEYNNINLKATDWELTDSINPNAFENTTLDLDEFRLLLDANNRITFDSLIRTTQYKLKQLCQQQDER